MKPILEEVFYISIGLIFYAYFIYPISMFIISIIRGRSIIKINNYIPNVTIIITAYNEEKWIHKKAENTLDIIYPKEKFQIIFVSDGSTDNTVKYLENYKKKGIELLVIDERKGKENAQKESLKIANGDILVFTDVSTMLDPNGVEQIVSNFADPTIGCVSSEDRLIEKDGKQSGENLYVRYEMWLRRLESRANSPVGLSGSFFAARKIVCQDFSTDIDSDFTTLLNCVEMGLRGTCDPKAIGYYPDLSDQRREFERKVRTILRGLTVFFKNTGFLNIFKYGLFSYQYFCHKLLRWLIPFFLMIVFLTNGFLATISRFYFILFLGQIFIYALFILSNTFNFYSSSWKILKIPIYFINVNVSIFVAWWRYLKGQRVVTWTPSER